MLPMSFPAFYIGNLISKIIWSLRISSFEIYVFLQEKNDENGGYTLKRGSKPFLLF